MLTKVYAYNDHTFSNSLLTLRLIYVLVKSRNLYKKIDKQGNVNNDYININIKCFHIFQRELSHSHLNNSF